MAAPNIAGLTTITGVSTFISGVSTTSYNVLISNAASSNQVFKLNTLVASNTTSNNTTAINVKIFGGAAGTGSSVSMASSITIPGGSSIVLIGKDNPVYIEENRSIGVNANFANSVDVYASYEAIS